MNIKEISFSLLLIVLLGILIGMFGLFENIIITIIYWIICFIMGLHTDDIYNYVFKNNKK